ncbi:Uncharacterised protein [Segatella copri]|nr:Uncharacterised protein [Segatella copri]
MACTECLDSPDLHLSESLTTKLCFTTKWLLCNQRVWTDRTSVHLILNHMTQLQEVSHTNSSWLVKLLSCLTIIKVSRAETWQACLICPFREIIQFSTIKDRSSKLYTQLFTCSTQDTLEYLTKIHT